jgi:toprim domain protein
MQIAIIVEGKNDRSRLRRLLSEEIEIFCTYGTPGTERIEQLKKTIGTAPVFIFTDNDASGKKIRAILRDAFPDAEQIYTRKGYAGVEGTPDEYLVQQLEKAGLEAFIDRTLLDELNQVNDQRDRKYAEHGR